jgi:hypothetical protein
MTLDAVEQRTSIPVPWAVTIFAVVTVGVFATAWLTGQALWVVALLTLGAALCAAVALTTAGPVFETRVFRIIAHLLLGSLVLLVASVMTALGAAEGALTASLVFFVVLASIWAVGVALVLAALFVFVGARRSLRVVATVGLVVTGVLGVFPALVLGGVVLQLLQEGLTVPLAQDLRDDLIPFLALFVAFVVFPALVFRQDLRGLRERRSDGPDPRRG